MTIIERARFDIRGENGFEVSDATIAMLLRREWFAMLTVYEGAYPMLDDSYVEIP